MKKRLITTAYILLTSTLSLFAQTDPGAPCGGSDPDATPCPIDSWVFIMAAIVMVVTTLHLRNKKAALLN